MRFCYPWATSWCRCYLISSDARKCPQPQLLDSLRDPSDLAKEGGEHHLTGSAATPPWTGCRTALASSPRLRCQPLVCSPSSQPAAPRRPGHSCAHRHGRHLCWRTEAGSGGERGAVVAGEREEGEGCWREMEERLGRGRGVPEREMV